MYEELWVCMKASNTKAFWEMKKGCFSFPLINPMNRRTEYGRYCESLLLSTLGQGYLNVQVL